MTFDLNFQVMFVCFKKKHSGEFKNYERFVEISIKKVVLIFQETQLFFWFLKTESIDLKIAI